jgi:hypothetical protein
VHTFFGSAADDTFYGTSNDDTIRGLGGNDQIRASVGNDILDGGTGNDFLEGGSGNDTYVFALDMERIPLTNKAMSLTLIRFNSRESPQAISRCVRPLIL